MRLKTVFVASAVAGLALSTLVPSVALAGAISRETLSRKFLDYCVFTQYRAKDVDRNSMIAKCGCASKSAMDKMEGDSFDEQTRAKLTGPQEKAIKDAIAVCFASK